MTNEKFQEKLNSIQEKIGEENAGLILDEIGVLLNDNLNMNKEIEIKNSEIEALKNRNEKLMNVNGNLLQQVSMAEEPKNVSKETPTEKKEPFNFRAVFDKNGNFIR